MKYFLYSKKDDETTLQYIHRCQLNLCVFKQILRNNIKQDKLNVRKNLILKQSNIQWTSTYKCNMYNILMLYVNNLNCVYDSKLDKCYYGVPDSIRCPNTKTSLNTVIRTLEYGTTDMIPLFWVRQSLFNFKEITNK